MIITIMLVVFCWVGIMLQGRKALAAFILVSIFSGVTWIGLNQLVGFKYNAEYEFFYVFGPLIPGAEKDLDRFYRQNREREEQGEKEPHA